MNATSARTWAAFGALPASLCVILFWLYRSPARGENSDPLAWGLLLVFAAAAIWLGRPGAEATLDKLQAPVTRRGGLTATALLAFCAYLAVARLVLDAFPNSGDELAYVMQAQTYGHGRLWLTPPAVPDAFGMFRVFSLRDHWLSQYPPGWALLLAPFAAVGAPLWIVNPSIGAAILVLFHRLARRHVGREVAGIGVLILGTSAFYVLNVASFFNHGLTTLSALAFALAAERYLDRGRGLDAVLAGVWIGVLGITRTQNVIPFVLVFAAFLALRPDRRLGLIGFGLGGAPLLAGLLAYHAATTGNPLVPPQNLVGPAPIGALEGRNLPHPATAAAQHLPGAEPIGQFDRATLMLTAKRLVRLHTWGSPIVLYGALAAFLVLLRRRKLGMTDWIAPVTVLLMLTYGGDGGNQYGPRYYFEAWPFAILTFVKLAADLLQSSRATWRAWAASALVATVVLQLAYLAPRLEREHRVVWERQSIYRLVQQAGLTRAIVVIEGPTGQVRTMDAPDLVRNGLDVGARDVIYAEAVPSGDAALRRAYPGRPIYVFKDGRLTPR